MSDDLGAELFGDVWPEVKRQALTDPILHAVVTVAGRLAFDLEEARSEARRNRYPYDLEDRS